MAVDKTVEIQGIDGPSQGALVSPTLKATINSTSNWTVPAGVNAILFFLAGGGGGGSAKGSGNVSGSSGGASGGLLVRAISVTPGSTIGITCGAGGTGASAGTDSNGGPGGASYLSAGNTLFGVNGANQYTTNAGFANHTGSSGSVRNVVSNTAGAIAFVPYVPTNFVVEMGMTPQQVSSSFYTNSLTGSVNVIQNNTVAGSGGYLGVGLTPQASSNNINSNLSTNVSVNTFHTVGGGSGVGSYSMNQTQPWNTNNIPGFSQIHGQGGIIGGGGAGSPNIQGVSGSGGSGHGGVGGSANNDGSGRGAGGGGGLTGAGNTANTNSGGNGGSGGGGGGGHAAVNTTAAGGNGGAGACLIYY